MDGVHSLCVICWLWILCIEVFRMNETVNTNSPLKDHLKTISTFILYVFLPSLIVYCIGKFLNITLDSNNSNHVIYFNVAIDTIFLILFIIINNDVLKKNKPFKGDDLKSKIINFILTIIVITALFFVVKIISGIICSMICGIFGLKQISNNQKALEELFKSAPVLMTVTGVIMAPVVEELVFRGSVRRVIKNKKVFVIVSGLLFGLVHVLRYDLPVFGILILGCIIDSIITSQQSKQKKIGLSLLASVIMFVIVGLSLHVLSGSLIGVITSIDMSEVINSVVYITMGVYFSIVFVKYDNIYLNIACHLVNNAVGYIILFTLL